MGRPAPARMLRWPGSSWRAGSTSAAVAAPIGDRPVDFYSKRFASRSQHVPSLPELHAIRMYAQAPLPKPPSPRWLGEARAASDPTRRAPARGLMARGHASRPRLTCAIAFHSPSPAAAEAPLRSDAARRWLHRSPGAGYTAHRALVTQPGRRCYTAEQGWVGPAVLEAAGGVVRAHSAQRLKAGARRRVRAPGARGQ